jgi:hypothetical protein
MDDDQVTAVIHDCKNLDLNSRFIVTEKQHPIRLCQIAGRWLHESQAAMMDREPNLCACDAVLPGRRESANCMYLAL